LKITDHSFR